MKKSILSAVIGLLIGLAAFASPAVADTQTFTWGSSPGAAGYRLYCGTATGVYASAPQFDVTPGTTVSKTITLAGSFTSATKYFCAAKAYGTGVAICPNPDTSASGCSDFSNEVNLTVPQLKLAPPTNLQVSIVVAIAIDPKTGKITAKVASITATNTSPKTN